MLSVGGELIYIFQYNENIALTKMLSTLRRRGQRGCLVITSVISLGLLLTFCGYLDKIKSFDQQKIRL